MKKRVLAISVIVFLAITANAQVESQAIGGRFGGGNYGGGFELTYQHALSDVNRLEFDLGINAHNNSSFFSAAGIYQWLWELGEGFNWYAGPGAQFLAVKNASAFGVGGQIGVEYNFNVNLDTPLLISIDTRPMLNFASGNSDFGWGAALGIRYTF